MWTQLVARSAAGRCHHRTAHSFYISSWCRIAPYQRDLDMARVWGPSLAVSHLWTRVAEADHIRPGSSEGVDWDHADNHGPACAACNLRKSNYTLGDLGWTLQPRQTDGGWDGMTALYAPLLLAAEARLHKDQNVLWLTGQSLARSQAGRPLSTACSKPVSTRTTEPCSPRVPATVSTLWC